MDKFQCQMSSLSSGYGTGPYEPRSDQVGSGGGGAMAPRNEFIVVQFEFSSFLSEGKRAQAFRWNTALTQ